MLKTPDAWLRYRRAIDPGGRSVEPDDDAACPWYLEGTVHGRRGGCWKGASDANTGTRETRAGWRRCTLVDAGAGPAAEGVVFPW